MGIEFSYAAETAFVSPTLLKIGVDHQHMTLVWALSPLIGFFVTPILGSLSDRCRLKYGRRRPFILLLALGVLIGKIIYVKKKKYYTHLDIFQICFFLSCNFLLENLKIKTKQTKKNENNNVVQDSILTTKYSEIFLPVKYFF